MREGEWEVCSTIYMPHTYHLHYYTCGTHVQSYFSHHIQCNFFSWNTMLPNQFWSWKQMLPNQLWSWKQMLPLQFWSWKQMLPNQFWSWKQMLPNQFWSWTTTLPIHTVNLKLLGPVNISTCWLLLTTKTGLHLTVVPVFHTFNQTSTQLVSTTFYHVTQYPSRDLNIPSLRHHYGTLSPNFHV